MPSDLQTARETFGEMLRDAVGIRSAALVRAFATVQREAFIGPGPWKLLVPPNFFEYVDTPDGDPCRLYQNVLVALDATRLLNNGEPASLARWLDALDIAPGESFLHVGCGVGYYTAIAAEVVGAGGRVQAIEVDAALAERARHNLRGYAHVAVERGDASALQRASFDAIFVNAGVTHIPEHWLDALRPGGRLVLPLTFSMPVLNSGGGGMFLFAHGARGYPARLISPVGVFHCAGARTDDESQVLQQVFWRGGAETVRSLRRDPHPSDASCWLHAERYCLSLQECD